MDLILWRHAQAEALYPGIDDSERKLTPKGQKQAKAMARWLETHLPARCRILVSPAERARQTAHPLRRVQEIEPRIAPDACVADLYATLQAVQATPLLLVGHQPTLGELAAMLVTGKAEPWAIRKGAIWWLKRSPDLRTCSIRLVIDPQFLP